MYRGNKTDKDVGRYKKRRKQHNSAREKTERGRGLTEKNDVFSGTNNVTRAESWACRGMMMMMMMMRRNLGIIPALS